MSKLLIGTSWAIDTATTQNLKTYKMKTVTTLFISIIAVIGTANANKKIEITSSALAVKAFTGGVNNNIVVLNWSAKDISGNSRFEIERSFYSNKFSTISTMYIAFANNNKFSINDNAAELTGRKIAYYRVKQIAADGTITYSNTTVVNLENTAPASITHNTTINFTASQNGNALIKILSTTGKTATVKNTIASKGNNTVEFSTSDLSKGIYTAFISVNGVVVDTQKVIAE